MSAETRISAVVFKEGDVWIIQGIEYDIVARAYDLADAPDAFAREVVANAIITEELGRRPLEGIKPAPERFRKMFEAAKTALSRVDSVTMPRLPVRDLSIRLAGGPAA